MSTLSSIFFPDIQAAKAPAMSTAWIPLSLTHPSSHLRTIAGLTLAEAAAALNLAGASSVHTQERRELGTSTDRKPGLLTLGTLIARARAYGLIIEVRARKA